MSNPPASPAAAAASSPTPVQMMAEINRLRMVEQQGQRERAALQAQLEATQQLSSASSSGASSSQALVVNKPSAHLSGIKLPQPDKFKGDIGADCDRWIRSLERYYELLGVDVADPRRVSVAVLHFTDNAELWWENLGSQGRAAASASWETFVHTLLSRFRPVLQAEFARNRLFAVKQAPSESVSSLVHRFLRELGPIEQEMHTKDQIHHFRAALKDRRIVYKLHETKPTTLADAIQVATNWEAQFASAGSVGAAPFMRTGHGTFGSSFVPRASSSSSSSGSVPMEISQLEQAMFEEGPTLEYATSSAPGPNVATTKEPTTAEVMKQLVEMQKSFIAVMSSQRGPSNPANRRGAPLDKKRGQFVQGLDPALVQDRLRKGLCIKCGEKGHMKNECPNGVQAKSLKD